jgi:hypothetical protein
LFSTREPDPDNAGGGIAARIQLPPPVKVEGVFL